MQRGFLLGKFMPPHAGHIFMCETAAALCDELTVLVCSLPDDPISGEERFRWMKALLPNVRVVHYDKAVPQEPKDHPDFWPIWRNICKQTEPRPISKVFGSEQYIHRLAAELGAVPILIDPDRLAFPVSGTEIRRDPANNWQFIPKPVRAFFQKRVVLFGAESVGKSTMTKALAAHFGTVFLPEYGRTYDAGKVDRNWTEVDFHAIASGHRAMRTALAPHAGPILFEDTDPLLTWVWQEFLLGRLPSGPLPNDIADLYLVLDIDLPWIDDGTRYQESRTARQAFQARCIEVLERSGTNFRVVHGNPAQRWEGCLAAVQDLFAPGSVRTSSPITYDQKVGL